MITVLSVASECAPLVKTGGLADVVGALPAALAGQEVQMRTLLPGYPAILQHTQGFETALELSDLFGGPAKLLFGTHGDLDLYVLDAPHLFDREGSIYLGAYGSDWPDNAERFAALSQTACDIACDALSDWSPQIVHCHDWQAGLTPYYMRKAGSKARSIITIHNVAFQGLAPASMCGKLGIDVADFTPEGVEYFGNISALKAGLVYADKLTTVSPTYAQELMRPEFGMGLEGVLQARRDDLIGILNGIDEATWAPQTDALIKTYKTPRGKAANKTALQETFGLPASNGPLCVVVSRLTEQKGLDLLLDALPTLLARGGQLALLGSGDTALEQAFADHPSEHVAAKIGYDEALSHQIMAGGDAILVPSRFEPCGLTQLYGLKYGTLPLVALTGGLADTVISASPAAMAKPVATGVQFSPVTSQALASALSHLCDLFEQPKIWTKLQTNAMAQPVGWETSAARYAALYQHLT